MSESLILEDKRIRHGKSNIWNDNNDIIGIVYYHLFSPNKKVEVEDSSDKIISYGYKKLMSLTPTWIIKDSNGDLIGKLVTKFSIINTDYTYKRKDGKEYTIRGDIWRRNFSIRDEDGKEVIKTNSTGLAAFKTQPFKVKIKDDNFNVSCQKSPSSKFDRI